MIARRLIVASLGVLIAAGLAVAVTLPDLTEVDPRIAATRGDLVTTRQELVGARNQIVADNQSFASKCARVESGSAAAAQCRNEQADLAKRLDDHCAKSVAYVTAYRDAVAPVLAPLQQRRAADLQQLTNLTGQFQRQAQSFDAWNADATKGYNAAVEKIEDLLLAQAVTALVSMPHEALVTKLENLSVRAKGISNVKALKSGDLHDTVELMRGSMKGKTPAQAKKILLDALHDQKLLTEAQAAIVKERASDASKQILNTARGSADPAEEEARLQKGYESLVTLLDLAKDKAPTLLPVLKNAKAATAILGVVGAAPDILDTVALLWEGYADGKNIDALEQLRGLADQQRAAVAARYKATVDLDKLYQKLQSGSQVQCAPPPITQRPSV